ncbi:TetR/AcrR family transcriptional regulator C-terminal domain-containing protein [Streptomyces sp. C11-1]|uniref:TetR/AcrR family transcriptional regulator C-terminal domain-containing protein n=1 Tax=Streptomyces durocortorensis TaxID=2811104 RepID=A0ABY9VS37_9ACTN|nr:TetR/AcrR family transcriptional regulator C-terminal domain-containing protein [Streptomyces durocortorensis]WNF25465.1 TetR/AcrR family transcriptional regulator C-terminal domain-containing protein [Streptomyces durocortorensis]
MVIFAGQGDARRSMALLWRSADSGATRAAPGPKPGLDVDTIAAAGIAVAEEQGMAALSMRAVGAWLGRTAMALYTYVPSKSELVDLMHDRVLAELPTEYDTSSGWRPAITAWADDTWAFYLRHPWVLQVSQARPVLGPGEYAQLETVVRILDGIGLEPLKVRRVIAVLFQFVRGMARVAAEHRQAAPETGVSDEEWWTVRTTLLTEVAPDFAERFPALAALESHAAAADAAREDSGDVAPPVEREAGEAFRVGLELILDGMDSEGGPDSSEPRRPEHVRVEGSPDHRAPHHFAE